MALLEGLRFTAPAAPPAPAAAAAVPFVDALFVDSDLMLVVEVLVSSLALFVSFLLLLVVVEAAAVAAFLVFSPTEGEGEAEGEASVMAMITEKPKRLWGLCEGLLGKSSGIRFNECVGLPSCVE